MSPQLKARFAELDERLEAMVSRIEALPEEIQNSPVGKSFSPRAVLDHMLQVEMSYFPLMEKATQSPLRPESVRPNFIYKLVVRQMKMPAQKSIPVPKPMEPKGLAVSESSTKWRAARKKLVAFLDKFEDDHPAFKHPLFGKMSPTAMYVILEQHQSYHELRLPS
jgi:hypothetical protein